MYEKKFWRKGEKWYCLCCVALSAAYLSSGFHTRMSGCSQGQIQHTLLTMTNFLLTLHQQRPTVLAATFLSGLWCTEAHFVSRFMLSVVCTNMYQKRYVHKIKQAAKDQQEWNHKTPQDKHNYAKTYLKKLRMCDVIQMDCRNTLHVVQHSIIAK